MESTEPIRISGKAYQKMKFYTQLADGEIAGLLIVGKDTEGMLIDDVILFEQTAGASIVELSKDDMGKFMRDMITQNKADIIPKIRGWWHSHSDMGTFWSTTDDDCIKRLMKRMDFVISIVTNKAETMKVRIDCKKPFKFSIDDYPAVAIMDDIPLFVECKKEVEEKVKEQVWKGGYYGQEGGQGVQKKLNGENITDEDLEEEAWRRYGSRSSKWWDRYGREDLWH